MKNYYEIDYRGAVIYAIINIINGKKYVGSCKHFNRRKNNHRWKLNGNFNESKKLQSAWNKYGSENFEIVILQYCKRNKRELKKYEQMWIDFYDSYNTGYNMFEKAYSIKGIQKYYKKGVKIGSWNKGRKATPEARRNLSLAHLGKYTGKDHPKSKSVAQYDLSGQLIREFDCARSASRETGLDFRNISACCKGIRDYHKEFIFVFAEKNKNKQQKKADIIVRRLREYTNPRGKKVAQFDFKGELVKMWNNGTEPSLIGFQQTGVFQCCIGSIKHYKGYVWLYADDIKGMRKLALRSMITKRVKKVYMIRKIAQLGMNENLIKIWNYKEEVANKFNMSNYIITQCCNGTRESHKGYIWKYADQLPDQSSLAS
jgi:group I intron endonuclease